MPGKTRILCVDDDPATNRLHALLLGGQADMDVVGSVSRPEEGLPAIDRHRPHVVLLDYLLGGVPCEDLLTRICQTHPSVRVIILSGYDEAELRSNPRAAGAAGFLTKGSDAGSFAEDVRRAIRRASDRP